MRTPKTPSPEAAQSLNALAAAVYRHAPDAEPELLCMATALGRGLYASVYDRIEASFGADWRFSDLRLHLLDGTVLLVDWVAESPMRPVLFLKPVGAAEVDVPTATMGEVATEKHRLVWRIGYGRPVFGQVDLERGPRVAEGSVLHGPDMMYFRNGADRLHDKTAVVAHCNFDYPGRCDLGAPVVLDDGRLAGVLVGGDLGPEARHQGAYMPIDMILPFVSLLEARIARETGERSGCTVVTTVFHHMSEDEDA